MKTGLGNLRSLIRKGAKNSGVGSTAFWIVGVLFVLQLYFVRELLAAELLFGMAFAALLALGGLFYVLGAIGERGFDWAEAGVRALAVSGRRGLVTLEEISRKAMRPSRSESAQ